ncbi:MAG: hypothetical protein HY909_18950 [Deltaproteobacteria bacterium]|nr:hypothetical protein [Deltaproteobacteria bacterium]
MSASTLGGELVEPQRTWSPARWVAALYLAAQVVIPLARARPSRVPPFSSRFSWSMFAGPLTARCAHRVTWTRGDGQEVPLPLPPEGHPVRALLLARTADEFVRASQPLVTYAEDDQEVSRALDEVLRRHKRAVDPRGERVLVSDLRCEAPYGAPFRRVLTLGLPR